MGAYSNTRQLFDKGISRLAGATGIFDPAQRQTGEEASVLVYNGLSWARGGPVEIERIPAALRKVPLEVVDRVTHQVLSCEDVPGTSRRVLFYAPDIPPMGYRLFTLRKSTNQPQTAKNFRIELQTDEQGWIRSIRDRNGSEMLHGSAGRAFGSLLFAKRSGSYEVIPVGAAKTSIFDGPVSRRVEITREKSPLRRTVATVYHDSSWVDLAFDVDLGSFGEDSGRVAVALPFDSSEQLSLDGAGFVYRVPQDMLPGGSARQFTSLHFAHSAKPGTTGVTIGTRDAALLLRDGTFLLASQGLRTETRDEGTQRLERTEPRGSNVQTFRFRLATHGTRAAEWKRFGYEFNLPLQAAVTASSDLADQRSHLGVSNPNVVITAFKSAEATPGWFVIRLQEIGGQATPNVAISSTFGIIEAVYANTVEVPTANKADINRLTLKPWQTVTIMARMERQGK